MEENRLNVYKVGGAVRDRLLGRPVTEVDWVVVGSTAEQMLALGFRPVGADFPVFLHPRTGEEYALARTERKSGRGYGGFVFHASPDVTLEEDLTRRDLTINAIAEDAEGRLIDPHGGQEDLRGRWLRHVSPAFAEDPLRVLRVARFAARYAPLGFRIADETLALMQSIAASGELEALTPERTWKEVSRALLEPRPDVFIETLRRCGALAAWLPEVDTLFDTARGERLLAVLRRCAEGERPLTVRWACLLQPLGEDDPVEGLRQVQAINLRGKVPRDCQELALLTVEFHSAGRRAQALEPTALLDLLQRFDIYRRPQRFAEFLAACALIADETQDVPAAIAYLRSAADAARAVQAQPLVARGFTGAALGEALREARLAALTRHRDEAAARPSA